MRAFGWVLVFVAVGAAALAVSLRYSPDAAAGLSLIAVLAATGLLLLFLSERSLSSARRPVEPLYPPDFLERAFRSGELGRQRIILLVETLQSRVYAHPRRLTPDEVQVLQRSTDADFRRWVSERLDALDRAS